MHDCYSWHCTCRNALTTVGWARLTRYRSRAVPFSIVIRCADFGCHRYSRPPLPSTAVRATTLAQYDAQFRQRFPPVTPVRRIGSMQTACELERFKLSVSPLCRPVFCDIVSQGRILLDPGQPFVETGRALHGLRTGARIATHQKCACSRGAGRCWSRSRAPGNFAG